MPLTTKIEGAVLKATLKHLTDGNTGSTWLGIVAAGLIAGDIKFDVLLAGPHNPAWPNEVGKTVGVAVTALWGWKTGKPNAPKNPEPPVHAALAN